MIELNDKQLEAVESMEGAVLVFAGAGSGKTRVLTQRIARLIGEGVSPYSILAITFTNKAANEMRSRVEDIVDFDISGMWISTFHSMCVRILRVDCGAIGFRDGFSIYDSDDSRRLIKKILEELGLKDDKEYSPRLVRSAVSRYKNSFIYSMSADSFADEYYPFISYRFPEIYDKYMNCLKTQNAMDFDDLLVNTYELFRSNPDILSKYQNRFRYILVDEYQDTNDIQYRLVRMLSGKHGNVFAVGDDDQSIYAFRGANINNILNFERDFAGAKKISLEQNYRSDQKILDVANSIIGNNSKRSKKILWSEISGGAKPTIYYAGNEYEEADYVANEILRLNMSGVPYSDMAVFYRANYLSRLIEERMRGNSIPYQVFGSVSFYEKMEIKDIVSYLTVIVNPDSDIAFLRSINTPKRGIGAVTLKNITDISLSRSVSLYEACKLYCEGLRNSAKKKIEEYLDIIERYRSQIYELPAHAIIEGIVNDSGYMDMLESSYYDDFDNRRANIEEFINSAYQMEDSEESVLLPEFLQNISLITDMDSADEDGGVSLMTIHMAKGLEFNTVFIIGMNEDIFPNQKALTEGSVEEERRLCYVAVTRAKKNLYMIGTKTRTMFGNTVNSPVSRFLSEIGEDLCEEEGNVSFASVRTSAKSMPSENYFLSRIFTAPDTKKVKKDTAGFEAGMRVSHMKFGKGTIISISGKGDYRVALIDFEACGQKKMFLSMAPLTIEE